MKKLMNLKITLLLSISALLLTSCSDVLNTEPITDEISAPQEEQVITTAANAELAIKSCTLLLE